MQSDADAQTLGVWIDLFIKEGFTPEQMKEASEWVALNTEIKYRSDLLPGLLSKGKEIVARDAKPKQPDPGPQPEPDHCPICKGTGKVKVPDFYKMSRPIYARRGYYYDIDVACRCQLGEWTRKSKKGTIFELRSLDEYEAEHPHWRARVKEQEEKEKAYQQSLDAAKGADTAFGQIIKKLVDKAKEMGEQK